MQRGGGYEWEIPGVPPSGPAPGAELVSNKSRGRTLGRCHGLPATGSPEAGDASALATWGRGRLKEF